MSEPQNYGLAFSVEQNATEVADRAAAGLRELIVKLPSEFVGTVQIRVAVIAKPKEGK